MAISLAAEVRQGCQKGSSIDTSHLTLPEPLRSPLYLSLMSRMPREAFRIRNLRGSNQGVCCLWIRLLMGVPMTPSAAVFDFSSGDTIVCPFQLSLILGWSPTSMASLFLSCRLRLCRQNRPLAWWLPVDTYVSPVSLLPVIYQLRGSMTLEIIVHHVVPTSE
jgi:hypothetical protein